MRRRSDLARHQTNASMLCVVRVWSVNVCAYGIMLVEHTRLARGVQSDSLSSSLRAHLLAQICVRESLAPRNPHFDIYFYNCAYSVRHHQSNRGRGLTLAPITGLMRCGARASQLLFAVLLGGAALLLLTAPAPADCSKSFVISVARPHAQQLTLSALITPGDIIVACIILGRPFVSRRGRRAPRPRADHRAGLGATRPVGAAVLRLRAERRAAVLGEMVPRQSGVLSLLAVRESAGEDLPVHRHQSGRKCNNVRIICSFMCDFCKQ